MLLLSIKYSMHNLICDVNYCAGVAKLHHASCDVSAPFIILPLYVPPPK